jgi:exonuclease SbcC
MKPLVLRLQGFGSYAGELEVDFAQLGRHGVFSITGPTGSGKSTIFDAIVYALYDDLPGFRTDSHIRSQYADDETPTTVTLTFEADGKEWQVERSPSQARPRRGGGGVPVVDPSRVVLHEVGAEVGITKKTAVATELLRLVGLTKAQFEQVVLIPQGKFEEVLKADTKDRANLLGRLFPVDVFRRTTEALKEVAAQRRMAYEGLSTGIDILLDQIRGDILDAFRRAPEGITARSPDDASLAADGFDLSQLDDHRADLGRLAEVMAAARDTARFEAETTRARHEAAVAQAARWDQWQTDLRAARDFPDQTEADRVAREALDRARTVARFEPARQQWRAATADLSRADGDRARHRVDVDSVWTDQYERAQLDQASAAVALATVVIADAAALEAADAEHSDLLRRSVELAESEKRMSDREAEGASAAARVTDFEASIATARAELDAATGRATGRAQAEVRAHDLEQALEAATERTVLQARVAELGAHVDIAARAEEAAAGHVAAVRNAWRAGLAGRLATHLVDGLPCPTCGSEQHPAPAVAKEHAPTDEDLQAAEDGHRRLTADCQSLRVDLAGARAAAEALVGVDDAADLVGRLASARAALADIVDAEADASRLGPNVEALIRARDECRDLAAHAEAALRADRAALAERTLHWEADRNAFVATHGAMASTAGTARDRRRLADSLTGLAASLHLSESAAAAVAQALGALAPTLAEFGVASPDELDAWARPADEIEHNMLVLDRRAEVHRVIEARIQQYGEEGGPSTRPDPAPLAKSHRNAADRLDDLVGRLAVVDGRIESIDIARAELATRTGKVEEARRVKEETETLAAACAGLGTGPVGTRVSLEHWVLAYYLRQVLAQANLRLDMMTGGRYALELNREYTDGRKPWGLDLSVLDAETGQSRPATTLSGGETFMAALSLALGLADVVSAGSNYSIGALFVDEGFGSLDGESLDTVVDVLRSLQDGGRMVGVISHVQELKDALPNGITLQSTNQGSKAVIHYPEP